MINGAFKKNFKIKYESDRRAFFGNIVWSINESKFFKKSRSGTNKWIENVSIEPLRFFSKIVVKICRGRRLSSKVVHRKAKILFGQWLSVLFCILLKTTLLYKKNIFHND